MAPKNARVESHPDIIEVHDTDSDAEPETKRQKTTNVKMNSKAVVNGVKNGHLKGRRRFNADVADMKAEGVEAYQLKVLKCRPGDDEGAVECNIVDSVSGNSVLSLSMLFSDTSDYPSHDAIFAFSQEDTTPTIQQVIESIQQNPPATLKDTLLDLLKALRLALDTGVHSPEIQIIEDIEMVDDEEDEDGSAYDPEEFDEFEREGGSKNPDVQMSLLQRDFHETIVDGYRPGIIRFGGDDFALSVSIPVIKLPIPPRALMAWDRHLLSKTQYLTLLITGFHAAYPALQPDGTPVRNAALSFRVGLAQRYKPGQEIAQAVGRTFGLIVPDAEDDLLALAEARKQQQLYDGGVMDTEDGEENNGLPIVEEEPEEDDPGRFEKFSLSNSLEGLLNQSLLPVIQLRRQFKLGWAGAELLHSERLRLQMKAQDVFNQDSKRIKRADKDEVKLARTNELPHDPLAALKEGDDINLPLTAFCYLVRRLSLVTQFCLVCHNPINAEFVALKPYVCDSNLCAYQYYNLNMGPSLEYEIRTNPAMVDLLVSLAYTSAAEGSLSAPFPTGMGLRAQIPTNVINNVAVPNYSGLPQAATVEHNPAITQPDDDGLVDFDKFSVPQMRAVIVHLIDALPPIMDMKKHLDRKVPSRRAKATLKEMDPKVPPAAWSILRWCVGSCTAHLEEVHTAEERIQNLGPSWRQFRFSVGAPDAEAKFNTALEEGKKVNPNMKEYPSLFAFHGSPMRNWHSIIRHGLWFKEVAHGRAFGNGVYLAKDAGTSMGGYAQASRCVWKNSRICPSQCVGLAEVINRPNDFVSSSPHFVIKDLEWIVCRYLLVRGIDEGTMPYTSPQDVSNIPLVKLDPKQPITISSGTKIQIPLPSYRIDKLLDERQAEFIDEDHDEEDAAIFEYVEPPQAAMVEDEEEPPSPVRPPAPRADDWKHDEEWVQRNVDQLMPPPAASTPGAAMAIQRELRLMIKEQDAAMEKGLLKELGWYIPQDLMGDNLFQWVVEMHSFEEKLEIAKDMKTQGLNSVVFEIRFPPEFPMAPPFFRIIGPRFLPFIHGGGGHVTGGGSICMDLLTSSGWLAIYSIPAILMQIKLAISNPDPRPARLARDWQRPYGVQEALEGFKRAAATHGWTVPTGLDGLLR